jgi:hypothetical protein
MVGGGGLLCRGSKWIMAKTPLQTHSDMPELVIQYAY